MKSDILRASQRLMIWLSVVTVLSLSAWAAFAQTAVTVTLTAVPAEGVETVTPTLTWSSTGAVSCEAGGGWAGTKAPQGSETVAPITRSTDYNLTCTAADGTATLTWTPPTQYTNGDPLPLTDLGGFKAYYGQTGNVTGNVVDIPNENATTYTIEGLTAAEWEFAMTAYTDGGVESDRTNSVFKVVEVPASTASASVSVQLKPNPPVLQTVESVVYDVKYHPVTRVASLGRQVGVIAYGVPCQGEVPIVTTKNDEYWQVPADLVFFTKERRSAAVVASCQVI